MEAEQKIPFEVYSKLQQESDGEDIGFVDHGDSKTWGKGGAGILIISPNMDEILLLKRSEAVQDPLLWGISGGARKETDIGLENSLVTAVTESIEEMGSLPRGFIRKQPYVYEKLGTSFTYETYILEIDVGEKDTFTPSLNWENNEWSWYKLSALEEIDLHPGVREVLDNYVF